MVARSERAMPQTLFFIMRVTFCRYFWIDQSTFRDVALSCDGDRESQACSEM